MKLSLGFSPCPNDTFIFDALVNKKIDTEGLDFSVSLQDVQTLNQWALEGRLAISKLSFPAFFETAGIYDLLSAGGALGKGVGPLLIAKSMVALPDLQHCTVAIPGENTTANFLLRYAFPVISHTIPMLFSSIEEAVLEGKTDLGVIIHENRFTYQQKGLHKVCDLGEVWEQKENLPIPLGGIVIKNTIDPIIKKKINKLIKKSIAYSYKTYPQLSSYVKEQAQEMEEAVMRQHIDLYVNNFTTNLGEQGIKAITQLYEVYRNKTAQQQKLSIIES